jgi:RHS repeat-associated protein
MIQKTHEMLFFRSMSLHLHDYGGDGKLRTRITEDETRHYRYAMGYNAIHEEDDYGGMLATNVFEPGASNGPRLAQMMFGTLTGGLPVYAYHDHLGTVRQWRFANKNSARAIEYDPYGNIYGQSGFFNMPRIYAHHEFDSALKQYRAPFRHYRPTMARWTTPDPMGMIDGPNMYGYVGGNPIANADPTGQSAVATAGFIIAGTSALALLIAVASRLYYDGLYDQGGCNPNKHDDYKHCVTSCRAARYSLNPLATLIIGASAEIFDIAGVVAFSAWLLVKSESKEALKDMRSNKDGLFCAFTSLRSCANCCRSRGYDPDAPILPK